MQLLHLGAFARNVMLFVVVVVASVVPFRAAAAVANRRRAFGAVAPQLPFSKIQIACLAKAPGKRTLNSRRNGSLFARKDDRISIAAAASRLLRPDLSWQQWQQQQQQT